MCRRVTGRARIRASEIEQRERGESKHDRARERTRERERERARARESERERERGQERERAKSKREEKKKHTHNLPHLINVCQITPTSVFFFKPKSKNYKAEYRKIYKKTYFFNRKHEIPVQRLIADDHQQLCPFRTQHQRIPKGKTDTQ